MKHTVESLKAQGYNGYQHNTMTGRKVEARYVLDKIAWVMNNSPERLRFTDDDVRGKKRVAIHNEQWTPYTTLECYAERDMTREELLEADKRLATMGIKVTRNNHIAE